MKQKPANHLFRVGTDAVRQAYRRDRAVTLADDMEKRRRAAAMSAKDAAVSIARDQGFYVCPGRGPDVDDVVADARAVLRAVDVERKKETANKPFMVRLVDMDELTLSSPLMRFGLRPDVVGAVANYLGVVPILQYVNVMYSSHAGADPAKSQLYHCDSDEAEQVKIFILCEEVTSASGPLTFLDAASSQVVRDRVNYQYKTRLTDAQVRDALGAPPAEIALTGPPGTTAFIDTSRCLHYGSRFVDPSARRVVVMLQYVTPLAFILPDDFKAGARFRHLATAQHDPLTSMVLGAQ